MFRVFITGLVASLVAAWLGASALVCVALFIACLFGALFSAPPASANKHDKRQHAGEFTSAGYIDEIHGRAPRTGRHI